MENGNPSSKQTVSSNTIWEEIAGYSRAVRVGNQIHVSGTTATGPDGSVVGPGDLAAQTHYILDKIEHAIEQLGGSLTDVIRTRIYLADKNQWEPVARAHGERFGEIRPANTLVQAQLVGDEYLVEIEATAIVQSGA